jgi:DNA-binding PadR family transcriptional regulator
MYIDILILSQLMKGPRHGYEIKKNVAVMLGKTNTINNNYLYPTLKRFEEMGAILKSLEPQINKPTRHIYAITEIGRDIFFELLNEFPEEHAANQNEVYNRLAFFELLEPETRIHLIRSRVKYIQDQLTHLEGLMELDEDQTFLPFSQQLFSYSRQLLTTELEFFEKLARLTEDHGQHLYK